MSNPLIPVADGQMEYSAEQRRAAHLATVPAVYKRNDERLAIELVLLKGEADPFPVFERYGYTQEDALEMLAAPAFAKLLVAARKDIDENGVGFKLKARAQAEDLLTESYALATDPLVSAAVRADLIKWTAKVAGYEPKDKDDGRTGSGGFSLTVIMPGGQAQQVVGNEPLTIEGEAR